MSAPRCARSASRCSRPMSRLPVVRDFVAAVREKAIGQEVLRSVTPAQMVVKIVHDHLVEVLGGEGDADARRTGSTSMPRRRSRSCWSGCKARARRRRRPRSRCRLKTRERKKVLMASLDVQRPAAQEQLAQLGRQIGVDTLPIVPGEQPGRDHPARAADRAHRGLRRRHARHRRAGCTSTRS